MSDLRGRAAMLGRLLCHLAALTIGAAALAGQTDQRRLALFLDNIHILQGDDWFSDDEPYLVAVSVSARLDGSAPRVRLERFGHGNIQSGTDWARQGESYPFSDSAPIQHWFDADRSGSVFYLVVAVMEQDASANPAAIALGPAADAAVTAAFRAAGGETRVVASADSPQIADLLASRLEAAFARLDIPGAIRAASTAGGDDFGGFLTVAAVRLPSGEILASAGPGARLTLTPFRGKRRELAVGFPVAGVAGTNLKGRYALQGWLELRSIAETGVATGVPSLIQSRFGTRGNFELVVPAANGGLRHFWRNNDDDTLQWDGPVIFATDAGRIDAVSVVQSNFGSVGNFEAIGRAGDRLLFFWRPSDPGSDWRGPIPFATGVAGTPALIQSTHGERGHFEVVVPGAAGGLHHYRRNNDGPALTWSEATVFGTELGRFDAASLIESNFGSPGYLEVVARAGDRLYAFRRGPAADAGWEGPVEVAAGVAGNPALVQGRFGARGDFELVVPAAGGGLRHYWRDNDAATPAWYGPIVFGQELGPVDAVSLIQSNYGVPGNLEVVARAGDRLLYLWRGSDPALAWSGPSLLATPP